jgi:hypothetical protein
MPQKYKKYLIWQIVNLFCAKYMVLFGVLAENTRNQ